MRFYVDTSVWRDYFEDRKDSIRPLGLFAFRFLDKCNKEKSRIIVSDIVIEELTGNVPKRWVDSMLSDFATIIDRVSHSRTQTEKAAKEYIKFNRQVPFADLLHAVIAKDEKAILISRDRHFEKVNIVETKKPEEMI